MKLRVLFLVGSISWFAPAQQPTCRSVEDDRIVAKDLAAVLPEFQAMPPQTLLGPSPMPGSQRVFHASELRMLAHRYGIELAADEEACFEWSMQPLDRALVIAAMQKSLAIPDTRIAIADMLTDRVPPGRIDFPLARLGKPSPSGPAAPILWSGDVVYGDNHRFPIWARVEISASCRSIVAAESLKAGRPIEPQQLRETTAPCFPISARKLPAISEMAGLLPLRPIPAGGEVRPEMLTPPNDVERGDDVHIEVHSGGARLSFTARAVTAGRAGDLISLRNPDSNKTFQARVTGKDTAAVDVSSPKGI